MEKKKENFIKLFFSVFYFCSVMGTLLYVIFKGDYYPNYMQFAAVCVCCMLALVFVRNIKSFILTLALSGVIAIDYFFILFPSPDKLDVIVYILCAVEGLFMIYTFFVNSSIGTRVVNFGFRLALGMLIYFLLPKYFTLSTLQLIILIVASNTFVTFLVSLFHIKNQFFMFLGSLLFLVCEIVFALVVLNCISAFGISGPFVEFITTHDLLLWFHIPSLLMISLAAVWNCGKVKKED